MWPPGAQAHCNRLFCYLDRNLASILILISIAMEHTCLAQQKCCVYNQAALQFTTNFLSSAPISPPDSSCSSPYNWVACSSGCVTARCSGSYGQFSGTIYIGVCAANGDPTVSQMNQAGIDAGASGTCTALSGTTNSASSVDTATHSTQSGAASNLRIDLLSILVFVLPHFGVPLQ